MNQFLEKLFRRLGFHETDHEHMTGIHAALHGQSRPLARLTLYVMLLFVFVGLIWANFAVLDEVTTGQGKIVPSSQVQVIQSLEGGILSSLEVHEGDRVVRDQVLLRINDTGFSSTFREGSAHVQGLKAKIARLRSEVHGVSLTFPADVIKDRPELVREETHLFRSRANQLASSLDTLQQSHRLAYEELRLSEPLLEKGAISQAEILRLRRDVNEMAGKLAEARNVFRSEAFSELTASQAELERVSEGNVANEDRVGRTTLRAPMAGIVKKLNITTVGGVIQAGMPIMEIVPVEDKLLIEAQVKPSDIAFIQTGQGAVVKVSAYDYSIYGTLAGKLTKISADTITDPKKEDSYYKIEVRTDKAYLMGGGKELPILPGMTVSVDILTGKKTVLQYLLKPLLKAKDTAMRER